MHVQNKMEEPWLHQCKCKVHTTVLTTITFVGFQQWLPTDPQLCTQKDLETRGNHLVTRMPFLPLQPLFWLKAAAMLFNPCCNSAKEPVGLVSMSCGEEGHNAQPSSCQVMETHASGSFAKFNTGCQQRTVKHSPPCLVPTTFRNSADETVLQPFHCQK